MNESIRQLEEKISYLERHVTQQDKAMLELTEEVGALRRQMMAWRKLAENREAGSSAESRDAADDRPPHY